MSDNNEEKMRAGFEKWWMNEYPSCHDSWLEKFSDGKYKNDAVRQSYYVYMTLSHRIRPNGIARQSMIDDATIKRIAVETGVHGMAGGTKQLHDFACAIYDLGNDDGYAKGREAQRESDAKLRNCEGVYSVDTYTAAIRANTGELK